MTLKISDRASAIKPSAGIAAKLMVSQLEAAGHKIIDFTLGEPDIPTPSHILAAAITAMQAGDTHYAPSAGTTPLRSAIADEMRTRNIPCEISNVVVGCGAKQIIFEAFSATLNPGDEVIVAAPYWVSYPDVAKLHGGVPVIVVCGEEVGFKLSAGALEAAITPRTRWVVLNSPNNPTGAVYSKDELSALAKVLRENAHVSILTDEIYDFIYYEGRRAPGFVEVAPDLFERSLIVNGMSKAYAMTGWRVGYAVGPKALIDVMVKMIGQSTTCASSISQAAALAAVTGDQSCVSDAVDMYRKRRDRMIEILSRSPELTPRAPAGAFYVYLSVLKLLGKKTRRGQVLETELDVSNYFLEHAKVAVVNGAAYGLSPYLRLSFATSMDTVEVGSEAIVEACAELF